MDLEKQAMEILRTFEGDEPYQLGYSGGKDSDVILHLAGKSGVRFQAVHNHTTVDAPETVRYVRSKKGVAISYPPMSMWQLIIKHKTPPTRRMRYCCEELKEYSGIGKKVITGVRKSESRNRRQNQGVVTLTKPDRTARKLTDDELFLSNDKGGIVVMNYDNSEVHRMVESCYRTSKTLVNPILEWDDEYLWWYIRKEQIEINPLYHENFQRIGCIGCPMSRQYNWRAKSAGVSLPVIRSIRTPISMHLQGCWIAGKRAVTRMSQAGKRRRVSLSGGWRTRAWRDR